MARYDTSFDETWDVAVPTDTGFPYTFPFAFDRNDVRYITDDNETWNTAIGKSGRYGTSPD